VKKIFLISILVIFIGIGALIFKKLGYTIFPKKSLYPISYMVIINSNSPTIFPPVEKGVIRKFYIPKSSFNTPNNSLFFQYDYSSIITKKGHLTLKKGMVYIEDYYFGEIYFQTDEGYVALQVDIFKK
jgi:hypothetical protein